MYRLGRAITRVWEAAASTGTTLCLGHGLVVDSDDIAPEMAPALAAIRTVDLNVIRNGLSRADVQRYLDLQMTDPLGQVVLGLVLVRNADIHLRATLEV
ncbi:hypothetical protein ACIHAR_33170 [Streptomyces sp. NPDC052016]|uniref:hypothetical protein n=1 Tax=Streptomyces sp. NPDC052016 TaxID=3365680 RepID=UPI0037D5CC5F